ncbi:MAG: Hcp family type VI secretion system effector [Cellvibrionaceae bacterium]
MSAFLFIEGVTGEVSDPRYKGWIDISRWKWDVSRNITSSTSTQGDRESANAVIGGLNITRFMDKATAKLFIEAACGRGKKIKLVQTKTGTGSGTDTFIEYTLDNAIISDYKVEAVNIGGTRPKEDIKISFVNLEVKYTPYDEDGNAQAPIALGFDTATNTKK